MEVAARGRRLYILLRPAWALCTKMAAVEKAVRPERKPEIRRGIKMSSQMDGSSCQMKTEHASSELFFFFQEKTEFVLTVFTKKKTKKHHISGVNNNAEHDRQVHKQTFHFPDFLF